MAYENGEWVMHGTAPDDPGRLKNAEDLLRYVDEVGFLPLFRNEIPGFSVEEHACAEAWWTGDTSSDPWEWRVLAARSERVAYGKFFAGKAGFLSLEWLPYFANFRRDGYDFDSLYEEGSARRRSKLLMDLFTHSEELPTYEMKQRAGFGKGGEKNFNGILTELQMQTYLVVKDFRQRVSKAGKPYGMSVAVCTTPEQLWGYDRVTSAYAENPEASRTRIAAWMRMRYPMATDAQIRSLCG